MNYLLIFCGCFALVLNQVNAETTDERLAAARAKCAASNGLTIDDISREKAATFLENPAAACYVACISETLDLYNADGSIREEDALAYVAVNIRPKIVPIFKDCHEKAKDISDKCERAGEVIKCMKEKNQRVISLLSIFEDVKQR